MEIVRAAVLGIIQGLTEFLPISSSAHLILVPWLFGWEPGGLFFDVSLHVGTAIAVLSYFWTDWITLAREAWRGVVERDPFGSRERRLMWFLVAGTLPAMIVGLMLGNDLEEHLRSPLISVATLVVFGVILYFAEKVGKATRSLQDLTWGDSIWIGVSQALALIPGVSRSGVTISAALLRAQDRTSAARFSFLLSTPVMVGAGVLESWHLVKAIGVVSADGGAVGLTIPWAVLTVGVGAAAITGFLSIGYFLRHIQKNSFVPFVIYRFALAGVVLFFYFRNS